jgi:hypothetical protein
MYHIFIVIVIQVGSGEKFDFALRPLFYIHIPVHHARRESIRQSELERYLIVTFLKDRLRENVYHFFLVENNMPCCCFLPAILDSEEERSFFSAVNL